VLAELRKMTSSPCIVWMLFCVGQLLLYLLLLFFLHGTAVSY
jgi:hypothetical protein